MSTRSTGTHGSDSTREDYQLQLGRLGTDYDAGQAEHLGERLADAGVSVGALEIQVQDGVVVLFGTVPDDSTKRAAHDVVLDCEGVFSVENQLIVHHVRHS